MSDWRDGKQAKLPISLLRYFGLFAILLLLTGCGESASASTVFVCEIEVDAQFKALYDSLGGRSVLYCPISPLQIDGENAVQYFETVLMVSSPEGRFSLAPLGEDMGYVEAGVDPPTDLEALYLNGHVVYKDFAQLYKELQDYAGLPVAELRQNDDKQRVEQYFQNLAFYQHYGSRDVHLLSLGSIHCKTRQDAQVQCEEIESDSGSTIDIPIPVDPVFAAFIQLYRQDFPGPPEGPAEDRDGMRMQAFKHMVLLADPTQQPPQVQSLSLFGPLTLKPDPPRPPTKKTGFVFYPMQGELGYDVPDYFWEYLFDHGGFQISGPPITHLNDNAPFKQCFTSLCLNYDPARAPEERIWLDDLGEAYYVLTMIKPATPTAWVEPDAQQTPPAAWPSQLETTPVAQFTPQQPGSPDASNAINLEIREALSSVRSDQSQEIEILITRNGQPVAGQSPGLIVELPDNSTQDYIFPPTDASGRSKITLPPIAGMNSEIIPYRVCLAASGENSICFQDSFVIWNLLQ